MSLSIDQVRRGNQVAIAFDDDGKELKVIRRGVITRVDTVKKFGKDAHGKTVVLESIPNGNPRSGIHKIWVTLKPGEPAVEVKNSWLALVKEGRRGDWLKIKAEEDAKLADDIDAGKVEVEEGQPALVIDETDLARPGKAITEKEMERLTADGAP